jgi:hypothetical protein
LLVGKPPLWRVARPGPKASSSGVRPPPANGVGRAKVVRRPPSASVPPLDAFGNGRAPPLATSRDGALPTPLAGGLFLFNSFILFVFQVLYIYIFNFFFIKINTCRHVIGAIVALNEICQNF